jgi:hypothetical protein
MAQRGYGRAAEAGNSSVQVDADYVLFKTNEQRMELTTEREALRSRIYGTYEAPKSSTPDFARVRRNKFVFTGSAHHRPGSIRGHSESCQERLVRPNRSIRKARASQELSPATWQPAALDS